MVSNYLIRGARTGEVVSLLAFLHLALRFGLQQKHDDF